MNNKVLILLTKAELGGAQVFARDLAYLLKSSSLRPYLAAGEGRDNYLKLEADRLDIPYFRLKLSRSESVLANLFSFFYLLKFFFFNRFSVVHLNSSNTLIAALAIKIVSFRTKLVFTFHGLSVLDSNYKSSKSKRTLFFCFFKFFLLFVNEKVFVSELNFSYAKKIGLVKKGTVILNGLTEEYLDRDKAREELDLDKEDFVIGHVGRLAYPKNQEFLIKVFPEIKKIIPEAKMIIIGDGPDRKVLEEKGKDIVFVNPQGGDMKYAKAFNLFVLPSIYEGLSMSLIGAVRAHTPVLASLVGGSSEVVGEDYCFEVNDVDSFITKFKEMMALNWPVVEYGGKFEAEKMVEGYLKVYNNDL